MPLPDIQTLKTTFHGALIQPADGEYDSARTIWNASINRHPALIARCLGTGDVVAAVKFARESNLLTAIRGGGHNVGGRALCDDGIVIDLSQMRGVYVDPVHRTARVQGGATLGDLDQETHVFGLAVPSGIAPTTGITGLALGGGVGWLVRKYGMSVDNMLSAQVVTADGILLTASAAENNDLFWALRGGGGNFGVVTSLEFQAHPVHTIVGGFLFYPRQAAFDVIRNFRDFIETAPEEVTAYAVLLRLPDATPAVGIALCYCGELATADGVLKPLRSFGNPMMDAIQPIPFPVMQGLLGGAFPHGNQNYWKSNLLKTLSNEAIERIVEHANQMTSPKSAVAVEYYGGAASRVSNEATAFAHRDLPWDVVMLACWTNPEERQHRDWARQGEETLRPYAGNAQLLGALDIESDEVIGKAFGGNLARLSEIKRRYDPDNFFRVNQNIKPA